MLENRYLPFAAKTEGRNVKTAIAIKHMNARSTFQDIIVIQIAYIQIISFVVQVHAIIIPCLNETHIGHKRNPIGFRNRFTLNIWLFDKNSERGVLVTSKANHFQIIARENSIVDYHPVKCQPQYIIMLEGNKLTDKPVAYVKEDSAFSTNIVSLRERRKK